MTKKLVKKTQPANSENRNSGGNSKERGCDCMCSGGKVKKMACGGKAKKK